MKFTNRFNVSLPPDKAWPLLMDIERIVPCMPGAELVEIVDDKTFKGKVSVKLGPVALVFVCTAVFEEIDNTAHRARLKAQGADAKGRGNANALIAFRLEPAPEGSLVTIDTDLNLFGAVAQYGRGAGMVETLASQIIAQFSRNLEAQIPDLVAAEEPAPAAAPAAAPVNAADAAPANATPATPAAQPRRVPPPAQPAKPISGFSLLLSTLWATIRGWFGAR
ncbi:MAG: SRPBCC family protein [Pigmentiphaga sp.]|uniref:SRPBCC family protein n=1 Tax=Pigmentiphaga sp. TaxID=1977564 RepID=UPI0029B740EC|nr:SRPBCC family protein [Pigmentiphaga sp.]MDX3908035.1 SRPBCC family protein [Pigmentiphaga sp.]